MAKMVGANYMGGKRNTARAKSRDVVGRAQRRHFGKQRLASALCVTQENRLHTSAPTLSFPEITLAHAHWDATIMIDSCATSSKVTSGDRLYLSNPSSPTQRNKPSKVLGALDTSDHVSMRVAIDRILKQPTLVGISTQTHRETAHVERTDTPMVRRSTQARLASKDLDARETVSKYAFDSPVTCFEIPRRNRKNLEEPNLSSSYWPAGDGTLSLVDSPGICDVASWNTVDDSVYAGAQFLTGVDPLCFIQGGDSDRFNTFPDPIYPLPRSSPFSPSSQSSDNSILDLDTSPLVAIRSRRPDDHPEDDVNCMDTARLHPIPRSTSRQSLQSFFCEGFVDEAQTAISLSTNSDKDELKAEGSRPTCFNNNTTFLSTTSNDSGDPLPPGRDTIQVLTSREVAEDDTSSKNLFDFLSDPHPWETIGEILKLNLPGSSVAQSVAINFTKDREGVGYVSLERSNACDASSLAAASVETKTNDDSTDDIHVVSSVDSPILDIVDTDILNADERMAVDTHESPCSNSSVQPLFGMGSPSTTLGGVGPCTHVHALQEVPLLLVIYCTQNEHTRSSPSLTTIVGTATAEPDVNMMYAGPCLFDDSDLEEDE